MIPIDIQLHGIAKSLKHGEYNIPEIGEIMPASLMIQDLDSAQPIGCSYMNKWGCEQLGTSVEEINQLGTNYYLHYFVKEESYSILQNINNFLSCGDFDKQHNFFQRVKLYGDNDYTWFYTVLKVVQIPVNSTLENKAILLSSPVVGIDSLISRVNKTLDQDQYIRNNYRRFAALTNREKQIITLLADGNSSNDIAEHMFISRHTVSTHRKNILRKIECKSFAEVLRFAMAFELI